MKLTSILCNIFLFFTIVSLNAQNANDTVIYWSKNRLLQWKDFQGKAPIYSGNEKAVSCPSISETYFYKRDLLEVKILCYFDKRLSWTKDTSVYLLGHEQLHFDISELYARKMRKACDNLKINGIYNYNIYRATIDSVSNELDKRQNTYDRETNHSINKIIQREWNKTIAKELDELKDYEVDYSEYLKGQ